MIDEEQLCKDYSAKHTFNQLKEKYGLGLKPIYRILRKHNIPKRGNNKIIDHDELIKDYTINNLTYEQLVEKFQTTHTTLLTVLKKNGVPLRSDQIRFSPEEEKEICDMYSSEATIEDMYDKYDITQYILYKILDKHGIPKDKMDRSKDRTFNLISEETISQICEDYKNRIRLTVIAEKYNISMRNLDKILKRTGSYISQEDRVDAKMDKALELYNSGMSPDQISRVVRTASTSVTQFLRNQGITLRLPETYNVKYEVDHTYFENINTFDKAQLLGMITADGYIEPKKHTLNLGLQEKDYAYLEWFKKCVKSTHPIIISHRATKNKEFANGCICDTSNNYKFTVCSQQIHSDIQRHNIVHRKTYCDLGLPDTLPKELYGAFLLGLIEGDGSVGYYSYQRKIQTKTLGIRINTNEYGTVSVLVQPKIGQELFEYITETLGLVASLKPKRKIKNNLHNIELFDPESIIKLYHILYDNASFVMKRKHDKYLEIMHLYQRRGYYVGVLRSFT